MGNVWKTTTQTSFKMEFIKVLTQDFYFILFFILR